MTRESVYIAKPGMHSYNRTRPERVSQRLSSIGVFRSLLLVAGLVCLGYYAYTVINEKVYQVYENWAFDQQISGRLVTFRDYLREKTGLGFLAGTRAESGPIAIPAPPKVHSAMPLLETGDVIGRVAIPRLQLSAVVKQGVDDQTLKQAVGHVPSTSLPGDTGNFAIAAHRDTLFRALKDIQTGDAISFQTSGGVFNYEVAATRIVKPSDVSVLRPDGGGLIQVADGKAAPAILTMITCYPFYYVGSAPKRFIVEAKLVDAPKTAAALAN